MRWLGGSLALLLCLMLLGTHAAAHVDWEVTEWLDDRKELAQRRFWVFFEDKGLHLYSPEELAKEEAHLLKRNLLALQRRFQGHYPSWSESDWPVHPAYIKKALLAHPALVLSQQSRWNNAVSMCFSGEWNQHDHKQALSLLTALPFVSRVSMVAQFVKKAPILEDSVPLSRVNEASNEQIKYGNSYQQLQMMDVPSLHSSGLDGHGVTILILDSGFNLDHPAIKNLYIPQQHDFVNDDDDVTDQTFDKIEGSDPENHGTMTLSCVGGKDPGKHYGPAYASTYLLAKTESMLIEDPVEEDYLISGLEWGEALGANIATASLGYQPWHSYNSKNGTVLLDTTIDFLVEQRGVVAFISVGNDHRENLGPAVPGDAKRALSVGAIYENGDITTFSSQGPTFDGRIKVITSNELRPSPNVYQPEIVALGYGVQVANYRFSSGELYVKGSG